MSTQEKGIALSQKVAEAAKSISNVPNIEDPVAFIQDRLAQLGIYGEEDHDILISSDCTEGDARCVFCEGEPPVLPVPRFKRVWRILKGGDEEKQEKIHVKPFAEYDYFGKPNGLSGFFDRPYGQWPDAELLKAYGPNCDTEIYETLNKRSNGRPFVVFRGENTEAETIDIDSTLTVLRLARRQDTPSTFPVNGVPHKLYPVGVFPSIYEVECPLHEDTLLFGGYCEHCKHNWDDVEYEKMQFARMAKVCDEVSLLPRDINVFMDDIRSKSIEEMRQDYPDAYYNFHNLEEKPRLRKRVSRFGAACKDPIFGNKKKY